MFLHDFSFIAALAPYFSLKFSVLICLYLCPSVCLFLWFVSISLCQSITPLASRYCLSGLPVDCQMKNITNPDQTSLLLEDLIIWTNYEIEVAAYNGAGRGIYSHKVTEWTLQGGEDNTKGFILSNVCSQGNLSANQTARQKDGLNHHVTSFLLNLSLKIQIFTCNTITLVPWVVLSLQHKTSDWCPIVCFKRSNQRCTAVFVFSPQQFVSFFILCKPWKLDPYMKRKRLISSQ